MNHGISWRTEFPVIDAFASDDGYTLTLVVGTCGREPELRLLREGSETVEVSVASTRTFGGSGTGDCQDSVQVELSNPLKDRTVIDAATGENVPMRSQ